MVVQRVSCGKIWSGRWPGNEITTPRLLVLGAGSGLRVCIRGDVHLFPETFPRFHARVTLTLLRNEATYDCVEWDRDKRRRKERRGGGREQERGINSALGEP